MSRLPLVLLLGLALALAGCGDGGGQDKATPTTAAAQPSPTAGPTPTAELFGPPFFEGELLRFATLGDVQVSPLTLDHGRSAMSRSLLILAA